MTDAVPPNRVFKPLPDVPSYRQPRELDLCDNCGYAYNNHRDGWLCPNTAVVTVTNGNEIVDVELALHKSEGKSQVGDMDPTFILEMGDVLTNGLAKYPNDPDGLPNWWKGGDYRGFVASILRHALKLAKGEDLDDESGLPHAAHIAVDAMFVRSWQSRGVGKDSRLGVAQ